MKKRSVALLLAIAIVVVGVVAGTLAWLTAKSDAVTNTFTTSDINIELTETERDYKMIPGYTIAKDPKVTVKANSEACYLFVKFEKSTNFDTYMTYDVADGWTALTGVDGVYYQKVNAMEADQAFEVLKGNQVTVLGTVTKAMMAEANESKPTLTFTAYASQRYKNAGNEFTASEAWDNVKP